MQLCKRSSYFFKKHIKPFEKIKGHLHAFFFSEKYNRYNLLKKTYKKKFKRLPRFKRKKYFKYDYMLWLDGAEGYNIKNRFSVLMGGLKKRQNYKSKYISRLDVDYDLNNSLIRFNSNVVIKSYETTQDSEQV